MSAQVKKSAPLSFHWLAARLEAYTIPRVNGVICISNYTRELVQQTARKTWVVPNAVDALFFAVERRPVLPPRILCVGNVDERKNQNAFIRATDAVHQPGKFELHFFGRAARDNPYGRAFFDLVEARPWCHYDGFVDRAGLREQFSFASGLALPSLEDNCPMVVLEAMAAGVPVAAARVGGVPDLVSHGETGLLFDPLDGIAMASSLETLLTESSQAIAAHAKVSAQSRFHPENIARRHVEIYREVLSTV